MKSWHVAVIAVGVVALSWLGISMIRSGMSSAGKPPPVNRAQAQIVLTALQDLPPDQRLAYLRQHPQQYQVLLSDPDPQLRITMIHLLGPNNQQPVNADSAPNSTPGDPNNGG